MRRKPMDLFQKVVTVDGPGYVTAINYDKRICEVVLDHGHKTYNFKEVVKSNDYKTV